jgi:sugar phosphate isomerase/epimerase
MSSESGMTRRKFVGGAAGLAGAAALGPWVPKALGLGNGERLVPPGKLGIQQWSVRDAITRLDKSVMGYLGGPDFPDDPTDLGPLVPLPGGFAAVFDYLASVNYKGFEFFSFNQGANGAITTAQIRTALDNAGLIATGTHTGSLGTMFPEATRQQQIDMAAVLGYAMIGTASDASGRATLADNPANPSQIGWQTAADRANLVGQALTDVGLRYYFHPEQNWFQFFNDPDHPELSRTHRIEWFTANTDASVVHFEPDLLHAYAGRQRFPDPVDGSKFDVWGWIQANWQRLLAWHVKDGSRLSPPPAPGVNPYTQEIQRTPTFRDVIYVGEGALLKGYPVDPDPGVVGYRTIFDDTRAKGSRYFLTESDSGPGPATDPGRSLRWAKISAEFMLGFRAGPDEHAESTVADEAPMLSEALAE